MTVTTTATAMIDMNGNASLVTIGYEIMTDMREGGPHLGMSEALYMTHTLGTLEIIDTPLSVAVLPIESILQFPICGDHQSMGEGHGHRLSECIEVI